MHCFCPYSTNHRWLATDSAYPHCLCPYSTNHWWLATGSTHLCCPQRKEGRTSWGTLSSQHKALGPDLICCLFPAWPALPLGAQLVFCPAPRNILIWHSVSGRAVSTQAAWPFLRIRRLCHCQQFPWAQLELGIGGQEGLSLKLEAMGTLRSAHRCRGVCTYLFLGDSQEGRGSML